jgi:processive 1,2-diacylglycerol beta-glucosyltransferase
LRKAVILSGALGSGHYMVSEVLADYLESQSWEVRTLDCMALLGSAGAKIGDRVFRRITTMPGLYDALHFSQFRQGTRLVQALDREATRRLVPAVKAELGGERVDLLLATFATGASVAAKLRHQLPAHKTMVLCTDVDLYWLWVWPEVDLFLVTSRAAAGTVRRYVPKADIQIVPPPVRPVFYDAPEQMAARKELGIPEDEPCVLLMGGGWGYGPVEEIAQALGTMGLHVLAVAGHNAEVEQRLRRLRQPSVHPFGFTDGVPVLMSAADVVITTPGATTCSEARVIGRHLVILDVFPGHGRQNLQQELERGDADACGPNVGEVRALVSAVLEQIDRPLPTVIRPAGEWPQAFGHALGSLGLAETPARGPAEELDNLTPLRRRSR